MKKRVIAQFLIIILIGLTGCASGQNKATKDEKSELTVAAASDLTKAFTEIGAAFEQSNNCTVIFSFGSTGTLAEQILNGAPFDVFAAANESVINDLNIKGSIVSETIQLYAIGRIGITTLKTAQVDASTMEALTDPAIKIIAIANPEHAPYGLAAKQAMMTSGLWDTLEPKLIFGKNISETLTYLTTGNADAAIIALSLNDESTLNFTLVDSDMHEPLRQAMAVVKSTKNEDLARKFNAYVNSPEGKKIMANYGFTTPED